MCACQVGSSRKVVGALSWLVCHGRNLSSFVDYGISRVTLQPTVASPSPNIRVCSTLPLCFYIIRFPPSSLTGRHGKDAKQLQDEAPEGPGAPPGDPRIFFNFTPTTVLGCRLARRRYWSHRCHSLVWWSCYISGENSECKQGERGGGLGRSLKGVIIGNLRMVGHMLAFNYP